MKRSAGQPQLRFFGKCERLFRFALNVAER